MRAWALVVSMWLLAPLGCGGDDRSACEIWGDEVCTLACDCSAGDACVMQGASGSIALESEADCRDLFGLSCDEGGVAGFDYEGCTSMLDQAMCVDTDDDVGAVMLPPCADQ